MINKITRYAIAMMVAGATVTATRAPAATATPNTYTNVLQGINIALSVYQQGPTNSKGTKISDVVTKLTTKDIIAGLSAATGTNFGKTASLVTSTLLTNQVYEIPTTLTNDATTLHLSATNGLELAFAPTNGYPGPNTVTINATNIVFTVTNNGGTNILTEVTGEPAVSGVITNGAVSYIGTNGLTNTASIDTNVGVWTQFTVSVPTNGVTNVTIATLTNVATVSNVFESDNSKIEIMSGTASAPVFTDVSAFFKDYTDGSHEEKIGNDKIVIAGGTGLTNGVHATNAILTSGGFIRIDRLDFGYFVTNSDTVSNLFLKTQGFTKGTLKVDVLRTGKDKLVEDLSQGSSTSSVNGYGYIGGTTIITNADASGNAVDLPYMAEGHEYSGTNVLNSGYITNPIPVMVEGTINVTFLKNLGQ